jgi:uncharacterized protein
MNERDQYPAGVPCWVETLQPDPQAALDFYGPLFGWEFAGPGPMPGDPPGQYYVAQSGGRDVAGIGSLPEWDPPAQPSTRPPTDPPTHAAPAPAWTTHVRVDSADEAAARAPGVGGSVLEGPFDALPAGRLAVLADPAGAVFCVWEPRSRQGAQLVNTPGAWAMSMLHSTDLPRAKAFYGAMFGWDAEPFGPAEAQLALLRLPGYVGGKPEQPVPRDVVAVMAPTHDDGSLGAASPHWSIDFWVQDTDATAAQAEELGGAVVLAPHDRPGFRTAVIADPQGAVFMINELRH